MSQKYTPQEVAKHNHEEDLWIVYKDGIYDITKFLKEHPGGEEPLVELAGKDATKCFDEIGHTSEAVQLREIYKIGVLTESMPAEIDETAGTKENQEPKDDPEEEWDYKPPQKTSNSNLRMLIGTGIAVYSVIIYYFWFS